MSFNLVLFALIVSGVSSDSWVWKAGSPSVNFVDEYPSLIAGIGNPGGRDSASTWTDASGQFWLFGGYYTGTTLTPDAFNDLWVYNTTTAQWSWQGGASDESTFPESIGESGTPGKRYAASSWLDQSGYLWLFGGYSSDSGSMNDMWKYDTVAGSWTWMGGSTGDVWYPSVLGQLGNPGGRYEAMSWTDNQGNFWLFGGTNDGINSNSDLWKFYVSVANWTWVGGAQITNSFSKYPSEYGSSGTPGSRTSSATWTDANGDFWLFGGRGYASSSTKSVGLLNDMWKFSVSLSLWTWQAGNSTLNEGSIATKVGGVGYPGARSSATYWTDADGNFWLFGGYGYVDSDGAEGFLDDLWHFSDGAWTLMGGSVNLNALGSYSGFLFPGARSGASGWVDLNGDIWLFGGEGFTNVSSPGHLNDLWALMPGGTEPIATIAPIDSSSSSLSSSSSTSSHSVTTTVGPATATVASSTTSRLDDTTAAFITNESCRISPLYLCIVFVFCIL